MHFESHSALAALTPSSDGLLPAEIVNPHSFGAEAANSIFVDSAFGAEVRIVDYVLEDSRRCDKVIEPAWFAGRNGRGADEMKLPVRRHPEEHFRLDEVVPIDQNHILRLVSGFVREILPEQAGVRALFVVWDAQFASHLEVVKRDEAGPVIAGSYSGQEKTKRQRCQKKPWKPESAETKFQHGASAPQYRGLLEL